MSDAATNPTSKAQIFDFKPPGGSGSGGGGGNVTDGGSGGDGTVTWKDYVDAQDTATRAQNDARFAEVLAGIQTVQSNLNDKPGVLWLIGVGAASFLGIVSVLAFGGDRFDGGFGAGNAVEVFLETQSARDADQDARLDRILTTLETMNAKPNASPEAPKAP